MGIPENSEVFKRNSWKNVLNFSRAQPQKRETIFSSHFLLKRKFSCIKGVLAWGSTQVQAGKWPGKVWENSVCFHSYERNLSQILSGCFEEISADLNTKRILSNLLKMPVEKSKIVEWLTDWSHCLKIVSLEDIISEYLGNTWLVIQEQCSLNLSMLCYFGAR